MSHKPSALSPNGQVQRRRARKRALPQLHDMPIPSDVRPGRGWSAQMRELAAHIGAQATLTIVARHGGSIFHVPKDPATSPFADVVDAHTAATIATLYGGNKLYLPVARYAVDKARRAVVIAAVREGRLSGAEATKIIRTSRTYVAYLVNHTDEGQETAVDDEVETLEPRQRDLFALPKN